jgi:hypothetical protein
MTMNIVTLQESTEALRKPLLNHEVYGQLGSPNSIQRFMELHVYAVWDFMSLLKALQQQLTCVTTPWVPPADPIAARMINQIVVGEESDLDTEGQPSSHFDLYLQAMEQVGADTSKILILVDKLRTGYDLETAMSEAEVPEAAQEFMRVTFQIIESGDLPAIASAFTIGRENLIPGIFRGIVAGLQERGNLDTDRFLYYLDRHIGLDEDEHGPLAFKILERLCGDSKARWDQAQNAALMTLKARIHLWDAISLSITKP